jgi:hypothetical protein
MWAFHQNGVVSEPVLVVVTVEQTSADNKAWYLPGLV